ncbi:hypothetical protein GL218_00743 [Daldinia childiae]|uniref:uncharacterized protein n=1 Tax=Daldinia childiae TaxID=326645 RepID=UPI001446E568|nr:uncharacterized protein GL218_00743 [Daldinia childiae]KAF3070491.1 hypothetical protein GL218_00743 [Daldinia childiae]
MSHQRYPSIDPKEPHSVSLKVLRPVPPRTNLTTTAIFRLRIRRRDIQLHALRQSRCPAPRRTPRGSSTKLSPTSPLHAPKRKFTRDVRIEAEMKTPGSSTALKLPLLGADGAVVVAADSNADGAKGGHSHGGKGVDLEPGDTLQRIVNFDLKEEGNHVLAVTVSYYEATETSGRTRTFRKLYQFICKGSLIVRTKVGALVAPPPLPSQLELESEYEKRGEDRRKWVMEAQLENCSEDVMQLSRVGLDLEPGLRYRDCNWEVAGGGGGKPVLHPGEVEQCCFVVEEVEPGPDGTGLEIDEDGRIVFGVLGISWRSEMGNKGFLSTGKLGTRIVK